MNFNYRHNLSYLNLTFRGYRQTACAPHPPTKTGNKGEICLDKNFSAYFKM